MRLAFVTTLDDGSQLWSALIEPEDEAEVMGKMTDVGELIAEPNGYFTMNTPNGGWVAMATRRVRCVELRRVPGAPGHEPGESLLTDQTVT